MLAAMLVIILLAALTCGCEDPPASLHASVDQGRGVVEFAALPAAPSPDYFTSALMVKAPSGKQDWKLMAINEIEELKVAELIFKQPTMSGGGEIPIPVDLHLKQGESIYLVMLSVSKGQDRAQASVEIAQELQLPVEYHRTK